MTVPREPSPDPGDLCEVKNSALSMIGGGQRPDNDKCMDRLQSSMRCSQFGKEVFEERSREANVTGKFVWSVRMPWKLGGWGTRQPPPSGLRKREVRGYI